MQSKNRKPLGVHKGFTIYLNHHQEFEVTLSKEKDEDGNSDTESFDTYAEAKEAIEKRITANEKLKRSSRKVALKIVTTVGTLHTITGVHSKNGNILLKPKPPERKRYNTTGMSYLPIENWVIDAVRELVTLTKRRDLIYDALDRMDINLNEDGQSYPPRREFDEHMNVLLKNFDKATKIAKAYPSLESYLEEHRRLSREKMMLKKPKW